MRTVSRNLATSGMPFSQKNFAISKLPRELQTYKGARQRIMGGNTNARTFAAAVPSSYKPLLFPGYAGHRNTYEFFNAYGPEQRVNRYMASYASW